MSGLAAGIRLALFDKKVLILERHNVIGGLNSFYSINGRKFDVGLHAMTNYAPGVKGSPLAKIFRQLRIHPDQFDLSPQFHSRTHFDGHNLQFSNDLKLLKSQIADQFPSQLDAFNKLCSHVENEFTTLSPDKENLSAKRVLTDFISDPILTNLLLFPLLIYGSSQENDVTWNQFVILFKSIYLEGLARPHEGIRLILRTLKDKYKSLGGIRKMKCGVKQIIVSKNRVQELILDNDVTITADNILSSAGLPETLRLCSDQPIDTQEDNIGKLSFVETLSVLKDQPKDLGWDETIVFYNNSKDLNYARPKDLVDPTSGVICFPNNYDYSNDRALPEGIVRITALANFDKWNSLPDEDYKAQKQYWFDEIRKSALKVLPAVPTAKLDAMTLAKDMFTPKTVKKYTGRLNGSIYGAEHKITSGKTHLDNLFICGTDQGLLGVTGAMISGIAMANQHILTKNHNPRQMQQNIGH